MEFKYGEETKEPAVRGEITEPMEDFLQKPLQGINVAETLYSTECNWVQDIPYTPINDYEKDMLKGTKNVDELLNEEKEATGEVCEEEALKQFKKDYINKIKVISLDKLSLYPLANPSTFPPTLKNSVREMMEENLNFYGEDYDRLTTDFNRVCMDRLFTPDADYTKYPIYS